MAFLCPLRRGVHLWEARLKIQLFLYVAGTSTGCAP